jgi:hypothetical protein
MGSLIHYENWDGVSAPAVPAGWTVSSPLVTSSSPTGGISPLSPPNVLAAAATGTNTEYPATYDIADSANGNVNVYASFNAASTTNNQTFGVFARGSAYPIVLGSSSFYWAQLSPNASACRLYAVVSGTETLLASVSLSSPLSDVDWYELQLSCQNNVIAVIVTNQGTGNTLNSSGNFVSGPTQIAISVTDSSVSGSGYAGLTLQSRSDNAYTDEWYFYQYSGSSQKPPLQAPQICQRARGRGRVIQPLAVRFGTPALPLFAFSSGIAWLDETRHRRASANHGWIWLPVPARIPIPPQIPFAYWVTVKRRDDSEGRRRIAPGRASTPASFARLPVPPSIPFAFWRTIRWLDRSELLCRINAGRVWCPGAALVPGSNVNEGWTQQYITSVNPPVQYGTELYLSWTSDAPPGLVFQVYENDQLVWHGSSTYCTLPLPQFLARFDIGTVGSSEATANFASLLPPAPLIQAKLSWLGGTFEGTDIAGFHVYGEESPGAGIDYTKILATIPAYTAGVITDGYGYGSFGQGGFGEAPGSYSWTSGRLLSGRWHFAVVPFDSSGNEGTGATTAVAIVGPPMGCSPFYDRTRLHYAYNSNLNAVNLLWNPSPG